MVELITNTSNIILFFIRLLLGATMIYYGRFKIKDMKKNFNNFNNMGFKPGEFWGTIAVIIEFFGGIFIILGIFSLIFIFMFAIQMVIGTIWKIFKTKKGFSDWSYDLLLLALCIILLNFGVGGFQIINIFNII